MGGYGSLLHVEMEMDIIQYRVPSSIITHSYLPRFQ